MDKIKEMWAKAQWPVKAIVIVSAVAVAIKVVFWLQAIGALTPVK